jgi:hypothetical protein
MEAILHVSRLALVAVVVHIAGALFAGAFQRDGIVDLRGRRVWLRLAGSGL